jgi:hypothetical protein
VDAEALGDRFVGRVLSDSSANRELPEFFARAIPTPHSVVTVHLIDEEGQPTAQDGMRSWSSSRSD